MIFAKKIIKKKKNIGIALTNELGQFFFVSEEANLNQAFGIYY